MTRGIVCPRCGGRLDVLRVRKPAHDLVRRYRRCVGCGLRVVTEERPAKSRATGSPLSGESAPGAQAPPRGGG